MRFAPWLLAVSILLAGRVADAQCGAKRSSCSACHDGVHASAPRAGAWHTQHAFADLCASCHGGSAESNDIGAAHAGLVDPLADPDSRCGSCHGDRTTALVASYRGNGGGPGAAPPPPPRASPHGERGPNIALAVAICAVAAAGMAFVVHNERSRSRSSRPREATS